MLTLIVEHNYICFYYKEFTTTTCFGPLCGPSSSCGWTYSLGYTTMRVVVLGRNGAGSRYHYPDTPGTMVPRDIMRSRTPPPLRPKNTTRMVV